MHDVEALFFLMDLERGADFRFHALIIAGHESIGLLGRRLYLIIQQSAITSDLRKFFNVFSDSTKLKTSIRSVDCGPTQSEL